MSGTRIKRGELLPLEFSKPLCVADYQTVIVVLQYLPETAGA